MAIQKNKHLKMIWIFNSILNKYCISRILHHFFRIFYGYLEVSFSYASELFFLGIHDFGREMGDGGWEGGLIRDGTHVSCSWWYGYAVKIDESKFKHNEFLHQTFERLTFLGKKTPPPPPSRVLTKVRGGGRVAGSQN